MITNDEQKELNANKSVWETLMVDNYHYNLKYRDRLPQQLERR
jgi:hypothetical protein